MGKSRLALEVAKRFERENPGYKTWCLLNRGHDLFRDLRSYFSEPGSFLIVADDANRLSNFGYVVHLLQERRPSQRFKVIVTVRDYALAKIRSVAQEHGSIVELHLRQLERKDIVDLVRSDVPNQQPSLP